LRFRLRFISVIAAALTALAAGCHKDKESLIVLSISTEDSPATGLTSVVLTCAGVARTFELTEPLSATPVQLGLYVASDVVGSQIVSASAGAAAGSTCSGYSGNTTINVPDAGAQVSGAIVLKPAKACPPSDGGAGATGGSGAGSGGAGGSGTGTGNRGGSDAGSGNSCTAKAPLPVGTPPGFVCCVEYEQTTPANCDPDTGLPIDAVAFSPDGKVLATAGEDGKDIKIWSFDGHVLTPSGTVLDSDGWWSMTFSADGTMLAVAVTDGIDLWNTSDWSLITELIGSSYFFNGVAFTPDQTHVVGLDEDGSGGGNLYMWDLKAVPEQVPILALALTDDPIHLAVAPKAVGGGLGIAIGYRSGYADVLSYSGTVFTKATNLLVDQAGFPVWAGAFSPGGTLLALGDDDATIHFWTFPLTSTAENGAELQFGTAGNDDSVYALTFSPDGTYILAGGGLTDSDSNASYWSATARAGEIRYNTSHDVTAVAFSPGGNAVAGGEINCGMVFMCTN
jgi:WD40 repeat protein